MSASHISSEAWEDGLECFHVGITGALLSMQHDRDPPESIYVEFVFFFLDFVCIIIIIIIVIRSDDFSVSAFR